jgi:MYXO-CTERM domain-containing protein
VAGAGDVNDDGYDDVVVGAAGYDGDLGTDEGRVYVYLGGKDGLGDMPLEIASDQAGAWFGDVVASAGDVDGDGYDDVIVAAPLRDGGAGTTFLFAGYSPEDDLDGDGSPRPFDCDDRDETVYPGAPELCDGKDNACAGGVPDEDADLDGDGTATCGGDCDDANAGIHPAAEEVCDGADSNCDGAFDADDVDLDGDAWPVCLGDCDDADPALGPGVAELCDDGVDNNCDGTVDEECEESGCACDGSGAAAGLPALLVALLASRRRRYRTSAA